MGCYFVQIFDEARRGVDASVPGAYNPGVIVGVGIDIIEVPRIARALERHGERFLKRIYDPREVAYARRGEDMIRELAARFAAKEAVAKALGTGFRHGVRPKDIVILNRPSGQPYVELLGRVGTLTRGLVAHVSLSHLRELATAVCVLERP